MALPVLASDGQPHVVPLLTDQHWLEIPEYLGVLDSPQARADANSAVVNAVLGVVEYKMKLWGKMPPLMQKLRGCPDELIQYPPMIAPPGVVPGQAPSPSGPPSQGLPTSTQPPVPGLPSGTPQIKQPSPPKSPLADEPKPVV